MRPAVWRIAGKRRRFAADMEGAAPSGILDRRFANSGEAAGIKFRLTAHGLQRTLNSLALQIAPGEAVRKVLGHSTSAMSEHYLSPNMDAKRVCSIARSRCSLAGPKPRRSHQVGIAVGIRGPRQRRRTTGTCKLLILN